MFRSTMLSEDILPLILDHLTKLEDYTTLYNCALVNRTFNSVASSFLYRRVIYAPRQIRVLYLRGQDSSSAELNLLNSSILVHNSKHVREVDVGGYLVGRSLLELLAQKFREAFPRWINLTSVVLHPHECHQDLGSDWVKYLHELPQLRCLSVNSFCMDATSVPVLTQISHLTALGLIDPTRALLNQLPDWLSKLSPTLKDFRLRGNCGSVTPGVLRSLIPFLSRIDSFALGVSYSLEDGHVLDAIFQLPYLHTLELRYYWQMKQPRTVPSYPQLRNLTVRHNAVVTSEDAARLCKWIRLIIQKSPIESLDLVCEENLSHFRGPYVNFHGLVNHLAQRHFSTLRILRMEHAFVGSVAMEGLCSKCGLLEELVVGVDLNTLYSFPSLCRNMKKLRSVALRVRFIKRKRLFASFDDSKAEEFFEQGSPALRLLRISDRKWERTCKTVGPSEVRFEIEPVKNVTAPWERGRGSTL